MEIDLRFTEDEKTQKLPGSRLQSLPGKTEASTQNTDRCFI